MDIGCGVWEEKGVPKGEIRKILRQVYLAERWLGLALKYLSVGTTICDET